MSAEPQGSLKKRMFKAGSWSILNIILSNAMRLGSNLVMTRLLVPEAFGLMSFIMLIVTAFALISDVGLQRSVVREHDGDTARYLRAAWVVQIYRGILMSGGIVLTAGFIFFVAPHIAPAGTIYADPLLPFLVVAIALLPLVGCVKSTTQFLAQRNFHNGQIAMVELSGQLSAILTQIAIALAWPSVWSLVIGLILGQIVKSALSHVVFAGPKMRWAPARDISSRIWSFGKFIMISSVLTFAAQNADKFILASLLGAESFGLYAIALIWIEAGRMVLSKAAEQIGFAALGEVIRTRPAEAPRLFKKFQRAIDLFCVTAFLLCFFLSEPFIGLLYTGPYQVAGQYLSLLGLVFLTLRFNTINMFVLNHGNSRALMVVSAIRAVAILIFLPLGYRYLGVEGALLAVGLTPLASAPYTIWLIRPLLGPVYAARQVLWIIAILCAAGAAYLSY